MTYACILLPFPVSTNNLFVNNPRGGRFPSKRYTEWKKEATAALIGQIPTRRFDGPIKVTIHLGRPDKRRRDLGNLEKAPLDLLVTHNVIADDSLVEDLRLRWAEDVQGCMIEIEDMGE